MTRQSDFKRRVRARMAKTGESYTAARAQLLKKSGSSGAPSASDPAPFEIRKVLAGYARFGGEHVDLAVLTHVLEHAGVRGPAGKPLTEAMVFGLMGGPGFMYFVFEYEGWTPLLTIVLRSFSMPDPLVDDALARLGVSATVNTTGSANRARSQLDAAYEAGKAAICTIDALALPYRRVEELTMGSHPQLVSVVGKDDDAVWLEDIGERPFKVALSDFTKARSSYKKLKHRLVTLDEPELGRPLAEGVTEAIAATARAYREAPYKGYASNFGLAGLEKWAKLLVSSTKKGWPKLFGEGEARARGLARLEECLWQTYSPALGGRALYADFLEESADIVGADWPRDVAVRFRDSARVWAAIVDRVQATSDETVRELIELTDRRRQVFSELGERAGDEQARLYREREARAKQATSSIADDPTLFEELAGLVSEVIAIESAAVDELTAGTGGE